MQKICDYIQHVLFPVPVYLLVFSICCLTSLSLSAGEEENIQEMTYEQIINELNWKKRKSQREVRQQVSYDNLQVHFSIGYLNSFSTFRITDSLLQRYQNGMQLTLGMDLFDPSWYTEVAFRNFGVTNNGSEEIMLKEFDLKAGFIQEVQTPWKYFLATGISNRFLHYRDNGRGITADNITPSWIVSTGLKTFFTPSFAMGLELQGRTSLVGATADVSSVDFAIRVETSL